MSFVKEQDKKKKDSSNMTSVVKYFSGLILIFPFAVYFSQNPSFIWKRVSSLKDHVFSVSLQAAYTPCPAP